jgi:hypothetical protein
MQRRMPIRLIALSELIHRPEYQTREALNDEALEAYRSAYAEDGGAKMPPIRCFQFAADDIRIVDGFHRYYAAEAAGLTSLPCEIVTPTTSDAEYEAFREVLGANRNHGVRQTLGDKSKKIRAALESGMFHDTTDDRLAEMCGASRTLVGRVRRSLAREAMDPQERAEAGPDAPTFDDEPPEDVPGPDEDEAEEEAPEAEDEAPESEEEDETEEEESPLQEAARILSKAHRQLTQLHQDSGEGVLREAYRHVNTAIVAVRQELKARS